MTRILSALFAVGLLVHAAPQAVEAQNASAAALEEAAATITTEDMYNRIYFLASDGLRGRDTPSPGLEAAAAYIVSQYRKMGVKPGGEDGFYQRFPFQLRGSDAEASLLELTGPDGEASLEMGRDFFAMGTTADPVRGTVHPLEEEDPEALVGADLDGAVAVFPLPGEGGQEFLQTAERQATAADEAGAVAVIHVLDPAWTGDAIQQVHGQVGGPSWTLGGDEEDVPQVFAARTALEEALADVGGSLEPAMTAMGEAFEMTAGDLEAQVHLQVDVQEEATPPNVIGMVEGSDPELRNEYVALSAHFDHIGVGQPQEGDSINNGADDNASGTSALMEVANALMTMDPEDRPARSVLFVHVSAEEKGLLGSEWWVENPTVPLDDVVANINADMIAGVEHPDTMMVIGKSYSELGPMVRELAEDRQDVDLTASPDLMPEQNLFYRSDQYHFMRKEIPSLFFFTGLHECYHSPCDRPDFIDPERAANVARLLFYSTVEIANMEARPEWDPEGLEEVRQRTGAR